MAQKDSHHPEIKEQPGMVTTRAVAARLIPELATNSAMRRWFGRLRRAAFGPSSLRVMVGVAALLAASICALSPDTHSKIVPLFLKGLKNWNIHKTVWLSEWKNESLFYRLSGTNEPYLASFRKAGKK